MKNGLKITIILICGIIAGFSAYYLYIFFQTPSASLVNQNSQLNNQNVNIIKPEIKSSEIIQLANGWKKYINYDLGFSIQVPDKTYRGECSKNSLTPVEIVEPAGTVGEYKTLKIGNKCNEKFLNGWNLKIYKNVDSFVKLEVLFKETYKGAGDCEIGQLEPMGDGSYKVINKYDGKDLFESKCFVNWNAAFRYNPEKQVVIKWNMGQDELFFDKEYVSTTDQKYLYDGRIVDSFKFE
jgi:hypothetical protein